MEAPPLTHAKHVLPVNGSDKGIFARMLAGLDANHGEEKIVMIDATHLKAHRAATSPGVKKGGVDV